MGVAGAETEDGVVPESVVEAMGRTLSGIRDLESNMRQFLTIAEPDVLAELPPLHRAQVFLVLAKCASERVSLCEEKFHQYSDWSRAPLRPSTTINYQAATRFIDHSLPDLTPEQRRSMRDISRRGAVNGRNSESRGSRKKRKYETSDKKSVSAAAQEFLEKAARELLGSNSCGLKGPLRDIASEEEEAQMN